MKQDAKDRRTRILELLRGSQDLRAATLAARFGVSERTIYRDMDRLISAGLPIVGTPGQGYRITADITLPPLNLTRQELEALHLGLEVIGDSAEPDLSAAAQSLSQKIDSQLAEDQNSAGFAFGYQPSVIPGALRGYEHMPVFRAALRAQQKIRIHLTDGTDHIARPLALDFWGRVWTCVIWEETQARHLSLRLDMVEKIHVLPELFVPEIGKRLEDR